MSYWDASALLPLLVRQKLTDRCKALHQAKQDSPIVWWGSLVECTSAVCRLEREQYMTSTQADRALTFLREIAKS